MSTKTIMPKSGQNVGTRNEAVADAETERFIADHHDEIEAKLQEARASIARVSQRTQA